MRIWIKSPLAAFTNNHANNHADPHDDMQNGFVIDHDTISELVGAGCEPGEVVDEVFDASQHVVLPGLISTHHHYYQTLTRATPCALNKELFPWLKSLYPIWARLTDEMVYVSTQLACAELLLSGCTTSADHHYLFTDQSARAIDAQVEAVREVGIRAVVTRGAMSVGQNHGGLPPENTVQDEDEILHDCERVIRTYHDSSPQSMLQIALAPCSPFSVSAELMTNVAALARSHKVKLHTHLAETHDETDYCMAKFNCRPLDYLEETGWLSADVWLAHGIHFNDDEIQKLGDTGIGIAHCPTSNMMLGSGHCRVLELQASGGAVGIGVDGSASNDCSNMMREVRQAFLLQRLHYGAERISHQRVLGMATEGSARCLGREQLGAIAVGKQADLALFKLDDTKFCGAGDALAALILCDADAADRVMVAGQWKIKDRQLLDFDLEALKQTHRRLARVLQQNDSG